MPCYITLGETTTQVHEYPLFSFWPYGWAWSDQRYRFETATRIEKLQQV